jgi:hypothetical protein
MREPHLPEQVHGRLDIGAAVPGAAPAIDHNFLFARQLSGRGLQRFKPVGSGGGAGVQRAGDMLAAKENVGPDVKNGRVLLTVNTLRVSLRYTSHHPRGAT